MIKINVFKIELQIKFSFVAIITMFSLIDKNGYAVMGFMACLIHEMGHIIAFFIVGYKPQKLIFNLTGICIIKPQNNLTYKKELFVQLSGCIMNLLMFIILCTTIESITPLSIFAVIHLLLGIINLLPLKIFDGGKLIEIILYKLFDIKLAMVLCNIINIIFSALIIVFCIVASIYFKNPMILLCSLLIGVQSILCT